MDSKKLVLYVDTSVVGGYFDIEFAESTQLLFDKLENSNYLIMFSSVTENELLNAPIQVKKFLNDIPDKHKKRVDLTEEAVRLADAYIFENVVGQSSREDCLHIAIATINRADIVVSWNFKHIVNVYRIRGYNAVNLKLGYPLIDIRSPKDIVNYEK